MFFYPYMSTEERMYKYKRTRFSVCQIIYHLELSTARIHRQSPTLNIHLAMGDLYWVDDVVVVDREQHVHTRSVSSRTNVHIIRRFLIELHEHEGHLKRSRQGSHLNTARHHASWSNVL